MPVVKFVTAGADDKVVERSSATDLIPEPVAASSIASMQALYLNRRAFYFQNLKEEFCLVITPWGQDGKHWTQLCALFPSAGESSTNFKLIASLRVVYEIKRKWLSRPGISLVQVLLDLGSLQFTGEGTGDEDVRMTLLTHHQDLQSDFGAIKLVIGSFASPFLAEDFEGANAGISK